MSYKLYAIVSQNGKEFKHYVDIPSKGIQSFLNVQPIVRRTLGKDAVVLKIGSERVDGSKTWIPPEGPIYTVKLAKSKFAFGRKFVPKDNDFDTVDLEPVLSDNDLTD